MPSAYDRAPWSTIDLSPRSRRRSARSSATSPRARSRPTPRRGTATTPSRSTPCCAMGELGLFGLPFPEEYGGWRRRLHHAVHRHRGARRGSTPRWPSRSRRASAWAPTRSTRFGTEEQKPALAARPVRRPGPRRVRAHRARRRQRRRRHPHRAPRSTRRRASGSSTARRRSSPTRARRSRRSSPSPPRDRARRDQRHHRARRARPASRSSRRTARWAGTRPTPTASSFDDCRVPEPTTCSASGARGFRSSSPILDDGRIAIAALAVGLASRPASSSQRRVRQGAPGLRRADRPLTRPSRSSAPTWPSMVENARLPHLQGGLAARTTGRPFKQAAAMAKLYATEAAVTRHA